MRCVAVSPAETLEVFAVGAEVAGQALAAAESRCGCNKNLLGALVHCILSSIMVSCHRQGRRFLDLARQLWQSNEPQALPLQTVPAPQPTC